MFESHTNKAMSTAILCLAVCVCDVMRKVGLSSRNAVCVMSHLFSCSPLVKNDPMLLCPEGLKLETEK